MMAVEEKMGTLNVKMLELEKELDSMKTGMELTKDHLDKVNNYHTEHANIRREFHEKTTEQERDDSGYYGYFLARVLCLDKAFTDLMKLRSDKEVFEHVKQMALSSEN